MADGESACPAKARLAMSTAQGAEHMGQDHDPRTPTPRRFLTVKEAAAYAKVSEQTIRRAIKDGRLKYYKFGRQIRIDEADLLDFMSGKC